MTGIARSVVDALLVMHLVGSADLARLLDVNPATARRWIAAGRFGHPVSVGSRRMVRASDVLRILGVDPDTGAQVADPQLPGQLRLIGKG